MIAVPEERPAEPAPQPARVRSRADLARELERLRVRAARASGHRRVSLERLAGLTGIPRSTVHSYVSGTRLPPADALDAIVQALGAAPAEQAAWAHALERVVEGPPG
jgi:transcriptional regulator with XRE-family HTH domain